MKRILLMLAAVALASPALALSDFTLCREGDMAACKKMYPVARKHYSECRNGNVNGCYEYGRFLLYGIGIKKDVRKGIELISKACSQHHPGACNSLGTLYSKGEYLPQDYRKANKLYRYACDKKRPVACSNLAWQYYKGNGLRQDDREALHYFGIACDLGMDKACSDYARIKKGRRR